MKTPKQKQKRKELAEFFLAVIIDIVLASIFVLGIWFDFLVAKFVITFYVAFWFYARWRML